MNNEEQIIIDGVDVSKCEFHQIEANELYPKAHYCGSIKNTFCEDNPNCYFKQLQRSVIRIKDLEERIINHSKTVEEYCSRLANKEQECEELKEKQKNNRQSNI